MSKRKRFVLTSILLSLGFLGVQLLEDSYKFTAIGGLAFMTLILFVWSLKEGLGRNLTLLSLLLPCMFTIGVGLFWFLLPANIFTRIPILFLYGFGIYAISLTMNIYTVSTTRTIALLRAARGVGFVLTLVTAFLLYDATISLNEDMFVTTFLVLIISFPLFLQGFWAIPLDTKLSVRITLMSLISTIIVGQIAVILYFWPVTIIVGSLFLTVSIYVLLGLGQARLESRLFTTTVREYVLLGTLVLIGMVFATKWAGY